MDNQIATSSTNTFCRLCLSGDTLNHVNIFKNKLEFQDVLFTTIIKDCLNIEVNIIHKLKLFVYVIIKKYLYKYF